MEKINMTAPQVRSVQGRDDLQAVQQLCWDYRSHLLAVSPIEAEITETFYPVPKYRALMEQIDVIHARPDGIILLAEREGRAVGCGMTHRIAPDTAEVKRVYVHPDARGHGIAFDLMTALMQQAKHDGYAKIVLDTSVNLGPAQRLYRRLGFRACGPYQPIPDAVLPHLLFFEADL